MLSVWYYSCFHGWHQRCCHVVIIDAVYVYATDGVIADVIDVVIDEINVCGIADHWICHCLRFWSCQFWYHSCWDWWHHWHCHCLRHWLYLLTPLMATLMTSIFWRLLPLLLCSMCVLLGPYTWLMVECATYVCSLCTSRTLHLIGGWVCYVFVRVYCTLYQYQLRYRKYFSVSFHYVFHIVTW